ncbi:MAG: exodeoxyribonuclease III [Candidatus Pacebacteria bacterium]|nr:exodeoxyribonuclease III [Candidatus Paceibacterota bacterium]
MKLMSWNVNGIRAVDRKGVFVPFIKKHQPDILCLQETKAQQEQSPIDLPDYIEYWNSAEKKGYSGTAIFTKEKPIAVMNDLPEHIAKKYKVGDDGYGNPNTEGRIIAAEFKKFFVVTVYTPNSKGDLSRLSLRYKQWDPAFLEYCKELEEKKPVIFCGDLNVAHKEQDLAHPKPNEGKHGFTREEREGVDNMINAGFIDTFRHLTPEGNGYYTWWSHWHKARERNVGWRIDYIFASRKFEKKLTSAEIHPEVMGSDHCPVEVEFEM